MAQHQDGLDNDDVSEFCRALQSRLKPGHLIDPTSAPGVAIAGHLLPFARAEETVPRVHAAARGQRFEPHPAERAARLVDLLDGQLRLNAQRIGTRLLAYEVGQLTDAVYQAANATLRHAVNLVYGRLLDLDGREALASELYIRFIHETPRYLERWDPGRGGFLTFLCSETRPHSVPAEILANHGWEHLRRHRKPVHLHSIDTVPNYRVVAPETGFERIEERDLLGWIRAIAGRIDPTISRRAAGDSDREIGADLGISPDQVRERRRRHRARIIKKLKEHGAGEA